MIRQATLSDLQEIEKVYAHAREFMKQTGNPTQWADSYPPTELIKEDIENKRLFLLTEEDEIYGSFAFMENADEKEYHNIENGNWLNEKPYSAIHRVASSGTRKGIFSEILDFCLNRADNLKIDTHPSNKPMQHVLQKHGFTKCGLIHLSDGSPRLAYQFTKEQ